MKCPSIDNLIILYEIIQLVVFIQFLIIELKGLVFFSVVVVVTTLFCFVFLILIGKKNIYKQSMENVDVE